MDQSEIRKWNPWFCCALFFISTVAQVSSSRGRGCMYLVVEGNRRQSACMWIRWCFRELCKMAHRLWEAKYKGLLEYASRVEYAGSMCSWHVLWRLDPGVIIDSSLKWIEQHIDPSWPMHLGLQQVKEWRFTLKPEFLSKVSVKYICSLPTY